MLKIADALQAGWYVPGKASGKARRFQEAVTKWETDTGIPDIENIMAISALFGVSIDELLSNETGAGKKTDYLFESVTEYDVA